VVALVMMVLSNNLVTAFGLMAVFAIVRFRNILRDTLDTSYILCVIVVGMAAGTMKFATAIVGCLVICAIMVYLWFTAFGTRHRYDTIINLHWSRPLGDLADLRNLLERHSVKALCASQRSHEGFPGTDLSYRLLMRDPERLEDLLTDLRALQGVSRVTGLKAEEESEV
jgi:Ca2+/Na+ antiporter